MNSFDMTVGGTCLVSVLTLFLGTVRLVHSFEVREEKLTRVYDESCLLLFSSEDSIYTRGPYHFLTPPKRFLK